MDRHVIEADIRKLEHQRDGVRSAEERVMLDLLLGDRRADLATESAVGRVTARQRSRP